MRAIAIGGLPEPEPAHDYDAACTCASCGTIRKASAGLMRHLPQHHGGLPGPEEWMPSGQMLTQPMSGGISVGVSALSAPYAGMAHRMSSITSLHGRPVFLSAPNGQTLIGHEVAPAPIGILNDFVTTDPRTGVQRETVVADMHVDDRLSQPAQEAISRLEELSRIITRRRGGNS